MNMKRWLACGVLAFCAANPMAARAEDPAIMEAALVVSAASAAAETATAVVKSMESFGRLGSDMVIRWWTEEGQEAVAAAAQAAQAVQAKVRALEAKTWAEEEDVAAAAEADEAEARALAAEAWAAVYAAVDAFAMVAAPSESLRPVSAAEAAPRFEGAAEAATAWGSVADDTRDAADKAETAAAAVDEVVKEVVRLAHSDVFPPTVEEEMAVAAAAEAAQAAQAKAGDLAKDAWHAAEAFGEKIYAAQARAEKATTGPGQRSGDEMAEAAEVLHLISQSVDSWDEHKAREAEARTLAAEAWAAVYAAVDVLAADWTASGGARRRARALVAEDSGE